MNWHRTQGADVVTDGVHYRTWAPGKTSVYAVVTSSSGATPRLIPLSQEAEGYFSGLDPDGRAGDRYLYRFDGRDWPDPASRFNPDGVHRAAEVIDPRDFAWTDDGWKAPALEEVVIYELHLGTFTEAGTFRAAIGKLDHLVRLGVTAIELMPVADFPGERNWGYDGVSLYAPARVYGSPNDLRELVDATHQHGLAMILDVVYNHLGPDGNYLGSYSREYFNPRHKTPWGDALNFARAPVRNFFLENAIYWRREFHFDGFRLDATHAIFDESEPHFLAEITRSVHSLGGFVFAEDERNEDQLLLPNDEGGFSLDAVWSDDFHHVLRVMLTGMREGYFKDYTGTVEELAATIRHGWWLEGPDRKPLRFGERAEADALPLRKFIFCIANHDQIGNQAMGSRLQEFISPAAYRAASVLLCLLPYTPLLLMGQEWAAATPFLYFTDHEPDLGHKITVGRREEFGGFTAFRDPVARERIPDPQAAKTFRASKLRWSESARKPHAGVLQLYQESLALRKEMAPWRKQGRESVEVWAPQDGVITLRFRPIVPREYLLQINLPGGSPMPGLNEAEGWQQRLSSNENRFGGDDKKTPGQPEVRLLQRTAR